MVGVDTASSTARQLRRHGAITGIGNVLPKPVLHFVALCEAAAKGDVEARTRALQPDAALGVLSSFDEGPDLVLYFKYLMVLKGHPEYRLHFNATDALSDSQRGYVEAQSCACSTPGTPNGPAVRRGAQVRRLTADRTWPEETMPDAARPDVIVIGAGVVGLSAALALRAHGLSVTVLDREGPAAGASAGNAGALASPTSCPGLAGILRKAPRWLLDPLGPLSVPPAYALRIAP